MSILPTPSEDPFFEASHVLKKELLKLVNDFFYAFEHEGKNNSTMSRLLRHNEPIFLMRGKEIKGPTNECLKQLVQLCADFANGHGKLEKVYECLEKIRFILRS